VVRRSERLLEDQFEFLRFAKTFGADGDLVADLSRAAWDADDDLGSVGFDIE